MSRPAVMDERIRHRRESVASADVRRRRRWLASLAAVIGLVIVSVLVAGSPLFSVTDVRVEGAPSERAAEARDAAAIRTGDSLLGVDLGSAADRVTALPWVAEAQARRSPPSVVIVRVTPRPPVAVASADGAAWLLDAGGVVIAGGTGDGLPVIEAPDAEVPPLGETVTDAAVRNALAVHASLPPSLGALVDRYEAQSVPGLRLRLAGHGEDGTWVRFGIAEDVEVKARAIGLLLEELERLEREAAEPEPEAPVDPLPVDPGAGTEGELPVSIDPGAVEIDVRAPNNPVLVPEGDPTDQVPAPEEDPTDQVPAPEEDP